MYLQNLLERFPSDDECLKEVLRLRNLSCCNKKKLYRIRGTKGFACSCGKQFYPLKGTIFERTRTPLRLWFYAMFIMTSTRAGISAKQLQREIGVTYKTAWRMFKQIRILMADNQGQLEGVVEIDEAYIGGRRKSSWRANWNGEDKEVLWGAVEKGGKLRIRHVPNNGKWTLLSQIQANIKQGSTIHSDELAAYKNIPKFGYAHESVLHSKYEYARGDCTTNHIENAWSHLKPGLVAVHRQVSKKYLQSYANEFAFRYNNRERPKEMFDILLKNSTILT